jgi:hypothetical protein
MSFSVVAKKKPDQKSQPNAKHHPSKGKSAAAANAAKVDALSTLKIKEGDKDVLSYSIADQKNHTGKNFTSEEEKQYTVFVKEINADAVTVSVKGPGVFESVAISRSPVGSPAGAAQPSPQTILGFEFILTEPVPVKKTTGMAN